MPCIVLLPLNDTFEPKTIQLPYFPDVVRIGRQTNKSTVPNQENGFFDSKVLSRAHAEMWANENGRACIKDIRSSNGTFVNGMRLSKENEESETRELLPGDTLELGIDILNDENGTIIHRKVSARVDHAGRPSENYLAAEIAAERRGQHNNSSSNGSASSSSLSARQANGDRAMYANGNSGSQTSLNGLASLQVPYGSGRHSVTIDMVIKRLSNDLRVSKQVARDLKQATAIFTDPPSSSPSSSFSHSARSIASIKSDVLDHSVGEGESAISLSECSIEESSHSLSSQLESTRRDLEQQQARVQELESSLMLEREARITLEEKWKTMATSSADARDETYDEDDNASISSDHTVTKGFSPEHESKVPTGMDEVSDSNGGGSIERLENLLRTAHEEMASWRVRAETAEEESNAKTSKIMELVAELERSHLVPGAANGHVKIPGEPEAVRTNNQNKRLGKVGASSVLDKGGRGAAVVSMVAVMMLGMGLMRFLNDYGPKKEF